MGPGANVGGERSGESSDGDAPFQDLNAIDVAARGTRRTTSQRYAGSVFAVGLYGANEQRSVESSMVTWQPSELGRGRRVPLDADFNVGLVPPVDADRNQW